MSILKEQNLFQDDNLSKAWAKAFMHRLENNKSKPFTPLIVQITNFKDSDVQIDERIHSLVNQFLEPRKKIETVANTIFPTSLWNRNKNRKLLFDRFNKIWPTVKSCKTGSICPNRRGVYFRRFVAYGEDEIEGNQIEKILRFWHNNKKCRSSAFQLVVFDPKEDHIKNPYLSFPCLHQVSLTPLGPNGKDGLSLIGYYATQNIFKKAYGNYLGLCNLGRFLAHEMDLKLKEVTCIAAKSNFDTSSLNKQQLDFFKPKLKEYLNN